MLFMNQNNDVVWRRHSFFLALWQVWTPGGNRPWGDLADSPAGGVFVTRGCRLTCPYRYFGDEVWEAGLRVLALFLRPGGLYLGNPQLHLEAVLEQWAGRPAGAALSHPGPSSTLQWSVPLVLSQLPPLPLPLPPPPPSHHFQGFSLSLVLHLGQILTCLYHALLISVVWCFCCVTRETLGGKQTCSRSGGSVSTGDSDTHGGIFQQAGFGILWGLCTLFLVSLSCWVWVFL